jgi:hypothetical protein
MADLQHVDGRHELPAQQRCLDRSLGVPGEQRAEGAVAQDEHDGAVVDVAVGERRADIGG